MVAWKRSKEGRSSIRGDRGRSRRSNQAYASLLHADLRSSSCSETGTAVARRASRSSRPAMWACRDCALGYAPKGPAKCSFLLAEKLEPHGRRPRNVYRNPVRDLSKLAAGQRSAYTRRGTGQRWDAEFPELSISHDHAL